MSKRGPANVSARTSTKTARVGERAFNRQAQTLRARAKRARPSDPTGPGLLQRAREGLRRVPRAAWMCAIVACINAACWSMITPPFQVPDEPAHFAYTQQLAENTSLPTSEESTFSPDEQTVLGDIHQYEVRQTPERHTIASAAEQRHLQEDLNQRLSRHGEGGVAGAYSTPPLYALLGVLPYGLASDGTLLDQLEAMRLMSALMAGLTALFVFLFLREAVPREPWAWTVGALSVALAPLLGFMSGAVNPDSMLAAVSASIFFCLARGFRRGLTRRSMLAIGALTAVGFLTKLNFIGLAPGIFIGMIVLSVRAARSYGRAAYVSLGLGLAIALAPLWLYVLANLSSGHPTLGAISTILERPGVHGSIFHKIGYIWQLYLPRLPGMTNYFAGVSTTRGLWFNHGVGYYGWIDTTFPTWVNNAALVPAIAISMLCAGALVAGRAALRRRKAELGVYGAMAVGLLVLIALTAYLNSSEGVFTEPRYLLPLLPILAAGLALAARGAGRRYGPAVGAAIVVLFLGHDIFSQLLVVGRFYG